MSEKTPDVKTPETMTNESPKTRTAQVGEVWEFVVTAPVPEGGSLRAVVTGPDEEPRTVVLTRTDGDTWTGAYALDRPGSYRAVVTGPSDEPFTFTATAKA